MRVVIIGGVAGGASCAARLRRLDENMEIVLIERSGYVSYANCGLPYYLGNTITDKRKLTIHTPDSLFDRFKIDVRINQEAISINKELKVVKIRDLKTSQEYELEYDKLVLSPGAKPVSPNISGINSEGVFTLRSVEDTFKIDQYIIKNKCHSATIVGGGFIGLEMAEELKHRGLNVNIIQRSNHIMPVLDSDMASILQNYIISKGINLYLNSELAKIVKNNNDIVCHMNNECSIKSDIVIIAIGVRPETYLAKECGLKLGINDAIVTDCYLKTSDENIYAVGDAIEINHIITNEKTLVSLAGPANKQGRIAADNICGRKTKYQGAIGSSIMKMFDMTVASTGLNQKSLDKLNIKYDYALISGQSHATYFPGATAMDIKVYFAEDGKILGAQIVGFDGVDKRIDVLATAIHSGMTCYDLVDLDLAYAPPYSSAKDPVNMVGYVICNIIDGIVNQVHWKDLTEFKKDGIILDTRTDSEYNEGHIEGAIHIPLNSLRNRINELPNKNIYVYCHSGLRSYIACRILSQNGFKCYNIAGGYGFYSKSLNDDKYYPCGIKRD